MDNRNNTSIPVQSECQGCGARDCCPKWLPVDASDGQKFVVKPIRRVLRRGEHLFNAGAEADSVDVVRSGMLKTFTISPDGEEEVLSFHSAGDLVGTDALSHPTRQSYAAAATPAQVCRFHVDSLRQLQRESDHMHGWVVAAMSRELSRLQESLQRMRYAAPARVASFLLSELRHRVLVQPKAATKAISISRTDMGRHLNLATETVSRICTRLEDEGVLRRSSGRNVEVLNVRALEQNLVSAAAA